MKYTRYYIHCHYYHYVLKCKKEKCIWKIFVKYTQIRLSNTNTNTNISSCGFSNTNTNTNTDICVFKYKYKYKYVFDPSPAWWSHMATEIWVNIGSGNGVMPSGSKPLYLYLNTNTNTNTYLTPALPDEAIWRQRSGSTLAQVMACCLTASRHYLNQCWLIITKVQWCSSEKFPRSQRVKLVP